MKLNDLLDKEAKLIYFDINDGKSVQYTGVVTSVEMISDHRYRANCTFDVKGCKRNSYVEGWHYDGVVEERRNELVNSYVSLGEIENTYLKF